MYKNVILSRILILFSLIFLLKTEAQADVHKFFGPMTTSESGKNAGVAENFDISFNTDTKVLRWVVNFSEFSGRLPNGFHLVLNDGPNPKGHDGELASFYFDASNLSQPKLTVYSFNGANNLISWKDGSKEAGTQPADKILSSVAPAGSAKNPSGWLLQLISKNEANGTRTLGFVINTTILNNHTPLYPSQTPGEVWKGAQFGTLLGIWFQPLAGVQASYENDGFLKTFSRQYQGTYDKANIKTTLNKKPVCVAQPSVGTYQNLSCQAETTTVELDASSSFDPEKGKQGLIYVWLSDCPGAQFDNQQAVKANMTFMSQNPNQSPVNCTVTLYVSDGELYSSCKANVSVEPCVRDCLDVINGTAEIDICGVCDGDGTSCLDCTDENIRNLLFSLDSNAREQARLAIKAAKRLKRAVPGNQEVNRLVKDIRKEANELYNLNWTETWSLPQIVTLCQGETICSTASNAVHINSYNTNAAHLRDLTLKVLKEMRRQGKAREIKNFKVFRKRAHDFYEESLRLSSEVPLNYNICQ